jgi:hypothetical protein
MCSRRKICSKVRLTDVVPAPEEPVTDMIGYFADTSASSFSDLFKLNRSRFLPICQPAPAGGA